MGKVTKILRSPVSRYGEYHLGRVLFSELKEKVWSENLMYWIQSLEMLSRGEEILAKKDNTPLQEKLILVQTFSHIFKFFSSRLQYIR